MNESTAVLWTGGKDSALALHECAAQEIRVTRLVTFTPENPDFLAHPLPLMAAQAEALRLPHQCIALSNPDRQSYESAISELRRQNGVTTLISGDIDEIQGHSHWMRECAEAAGVKIIAPLWKQERRKILDRLTDLGFEVILSCVKRPWLGPEWAGKTLSRESVEEFFRIPGMDPCGEQGEYHTMTLNAPLFHERVRLEWTPETREELTFLRICKITLDGRGVTPCTR